MVVHTVLFWLKPGTTDQDRQAFGKGLEGLVKIKNVKNLYVGAPARAATNPVVDASFDFALTVLFADVAALDAYDVDPIHKGLIAKFSPSWQKVLVYDAQ